MRVFSINSAWVVSPKPPSGELEGFPKIMQGDEFTVEREIVKEGKLYYQLVEFGTQHLFDSRAFKKL